MKRATLLGVACAVGLGSAAISSAHAEPLEGFGTNIPLAFAVRQIVPSGYLVNYDGGVDQSSRVSWSGGADWRDVLESLARAKRLSVTYQGQLVRLSPAGGPATSAAPAVEGARRVGGLLMVPYRSPAEVAAAAAPQPLPEPPPVAVSASLPPPPPEAPEAAPAPAPAPAPVPAARGRRGAQQAAPAPAPAPAPVRAPVTGSSTWRAQQGETLDQVMSDWAERAGWTLVFQSRMIYELQASADFQGDFVEAAATLIRSVRARPMPIATFYSGNRVLVISNSADGAN